MLLVAAYWRTNLILRQLAPLFGISKSAADRIINHLGPSLALLPRKRFPKDTVLIVDGTLVPTRDHTFAEQTKNYRYSTNHQVVVDADTRLVAAVGRPLPGNRNDCKAWELSGAKDAVGRTAVIAETAATGAPAWSSLTAASAARPNSPLERGAQRVPPQGLLPRRARLRPHEGVEDPPRLPPERRRRPPRHARHRPPAQPHPGRITEERAGQSARRRSFAGQPLDAVVGTSGWGGLEGGADRGPQDVDASASGGGHGLLGIARQPGPDHPAPGPSPKPWAAST